MALTADYLCKASEVIGTASSLREAASILRAQDPALRVVLVDATDMRDETPEQLLGARRYYLARSSGHCWSITREPLEATALILTEV